MKREPMAAACMAMFRTLGIELGEDATAKEALYLFDQLAAADFADDVLAAGATHLGCSRFMTFDAAAAHLARAELLP